MLELSWPISLAPSQLEKLELFRQLLMTWNARMNLTAITEEREVYVKHFYDSLTICQMGEWVKRVPQGARVLDVGTGAGFPGIPLAIALPNVQFVLNDALQKRVNFLTAVVEELELDNVVCIHGRSEDLARDKMYRAAFDAVVSRAVARLNVLMELMSPFLRVDGIGCSYKGPKVAEEWQDAVRAAGKLNATLLPSWAYTLPDGLGDRNILPWVQVKGVPRAYPRKAGTPQRMPL